MEGEKNRIKSNIKRFLSQYDINRKKKHNRYVIEITLKI